MEIVILDGDTVTRFDIDLSVFEKLGQTTVYGFTENKDVIKNIGDADVVFCNKSMITDEVMEACRNLKYIGLFATGYNNVDIESAKRHGITVCNAPLYSTNSVAQHVFAMILEFNNHIKDYADGVREGNWVASKLFSYFNIPIYEIAGQTLGIYGFGSIGKKVCEIAKAFGMNVIVHTRTVPENNIYGVEFVSEKELFERSDVLTLHCPLTDKTKGLVNKEKLALMKKSAIIINTSRGPVINEQDLADALNNGDIAGAGLDVVSVEPMKADNPLREAKNCLITPHIAWAPLQTRQRLIGIVLDNYNAWLEGNPKNVVK